MKINIRYIVIGVTIGVVVQMVVILTIILYTLRKSTISKEGDKKLCKVMRDAYDSLKNKHGYVKIVNGFNIINNTLSFNNITLDPLDGGYCLGYCYFTKSLFDKTLVKVLNEGAKSIYDVLFIKNTELNIYKVKEVRISCKVRYEIDKLVYEILKAARYFQYRMSNRIFFCNCNIIIPKAYINNQTAIRFNVHKILSKVGIYKSKMNRTLDLKTFILSKIDNNQLVIISMNIYGDNKCGHSVLAYKYEVLNSDEIKVFVYDCNIPITEEKDVSEYVYILFKLINGEWQYTYRPFIEEYNYKYDSYIPGAIIIFM